jgi:protein-S-isoprenylcysteine O-methyltransferase Ste14
LIRLQALPKFENVFNTAMTKSSKSNNNNNNPSSMGGGDKSGSENGFVLPQFDFSAVTDLLESIQPEDILANFQAGASNTLSQDGFGKRGELYTIGQFALIGAILVGGIPVVSPVLTVVLGPGMTLLGLVLLVLSVRDLGTALSPWPSPPSEAPLATDGIYGKMRHPMYTGVLCTLLGYSILLDSSTRLVLVAALWAFLEVKADKEEEFLLASKPGYANYMVRRYIFSLWKLY